MKIGFAVCGSFCTFSKVFPIMEELCKEYDVYPIFSTISSTTDSRFGKATDFIQSRNPLQKARMELHCRGRAHRAEETIGRFDHCALHREYFGKVGSRHCRWGCDNGCQKPSQEWKAGDCGRFNQRRSFRCCGKHWKTYGQEKLLFRALFTRRSCAKTNKPGCRIFKDSSHIIRRIERPTNSAITSAIILFTSFMYYGIFTKKP